MKCGWDEHKLNKSYPRVDILPFESDRQFMATINTDANSNENYIYLKGYIEVLSPLYDTSGNSFCLLGSKLLSA